MTTLEELIVHFEGLPCACEREELQLYICLSQDCPYHWSHKFFCKLCMDDCELHRHWGVKNIPTYLKELVTLWIATEEYFTQLKEIVDDKLKALGPSIRKQESRLKSKGERPYTRWISKDMELFKRNESIIEEALLLAKLNQSEANYHGLINEA